MSLRIFISSVQKEFAGERAALRDFLRGDALMRRFFDPFLFEEVPAADRRADAGEVTPPVTPPVVIMVRLLSELGELGSAEIRLHLGLRDRTHLRERYVDPSLDGGWIEMTIPDKPNSRLQKYRLTAKSAALLASVTEGKST